MKNIKERLATLNLPDVLCPFGERITTGEEFDAVRGRILDMLEAEEYGRMPGAPEKMWVEEVKCDARFCAGKAEKKELILHAIYNGEELQFPFHSVIPTKVSGKVPFFVFINFAGIISEKYYPAEEIVDRGYAVLCAHYNEITSDDGNFENGIARVLVKNRTADDAPGKITLWAWALMRIIDYAETVDKLDMNYLAVTGHSRLGKTTLVTAAHDKRVKFACPNDSGTSGDALSRGTRGETVADITRVFPYWFCPKYATYAGRENELPFDQHFLLSLIAPRHIAVASAEEDIWADPENQFLSLSLVNSVYGLYGMKGLVHGEDIPEAHCVLSEGDSSFHTRHGLHYFSREDWNIFMDFIDMKRK
ncbi:MAG: hypothetical protein IJF38_06675 [Clostridia bacterium]|nr:hypothetical protein [Clostridia bacterium]